MIIYLIRRNFLFKEVNDNELMSKTHKKLSRALKYILITYLL